MKYEVITIHVFFVNIKVRFYVHVNVWFEKSQDYLFSHLKEEKNVSAYQHLSIMYTLTRFSMSCLINYESLTGLLIQGCWDLHPPKWRTALPKIIR